MSNFNISEVRLLSVPLESDYKDTLYFTDKTNQEAYFKSKTIKEYSNFTYQRKDKTIYVPDHYDDIYMCNYVMYKNSSYSSKWYYAFIKQLEYESDNCTKVIIDTDVMQTWFFDYTIKPSFVEREHVSDDTIGKHTIPEGLETGEYECQSHETDTNIDSVLNDLCYIMGSTSQPVAGDAKDTPAGSDIYNGIYSGVKYYRYDAASAIDILLEIYANHSKVDTITGIFMAPKVLAPLKEGVTFREVATSNAPISYTISKSKNTGIGGYSPRNNKLKCYPYNYLVVSNNNGSNAIYHYEKFSGSNCGFTVKGALTPGCSIRLTPNNYNGVASNDEESINLGKFPICNFTCDMYTNWLTQNSINIAGHSVSSDDLAMISSGVSSALQVAGGIGMIASGAGALAGAGMIASGVAGSSGIAGALMQKQQHDKIPQQARGNLNCGDVITSDSKNTFHFYKMSIKQEYAKILDHFFDMFGYQVNHIKVPNKAHRGRWWYTKTKDINIDGSIPQDDMQKIKSVYNSGVTFWRNANEISNYELSNNIV